ncbi:hypothetical protein [Microbacterium sp.]|uniref:COG1470 family protein n=1 Tax=Microbacterium sp. TaxID=51671 RepID=UPI003A865E75
MRSRVAAASAVAVALVSGAPPAPAWVQAPASASSPAWVQASASAPLPASLPTRDMPRVEWEMGEGDPGVPHGDAGSGEEMDGEAGSDDGVGVDGDEADGLRAGWAVAITGAGGALGPFTTVEVYSGARSAVGVEVHNTEAHPLAVTVGSLAASAPGGTLAFTARESVTDPSVWVSGAGEVVVVAPGTVAQVPLVVSIPGSTPGGDYALGLAVTDQESGVAEVLPLLLRVSGDDRIVELDVETDVSLSGASTWPAGETAVTVDYRVRNVGTTALIGDLDIAVTTLFSCTTPLRALPRAVILPGEELRGEATGTATAVGAAQAEVSFAATAPTIATAPPSRPTPDVSTTPDVPGVIRPLPATGDGAQEPATEPEPAWMQTSRGAPTVAIPFQALTVVSLLLVGVLGVWMWARRRAAHATELLQHVE